MLVDDSSRLDLHRKALEHRIVQEGMELWKKQQEFAKLKKLREQKEIKEMLELYWPFERANDARPRGLRNLRLEGLFPNNDYINNKRFVGGTLDLGRPGGGAPLVNAAGKKVTKTREDPLLRFQFGSNDLRRCVDNTLRYKTNKQAQQQYKKDLDKLVEEKRQQQEKQKKEECEFQLKQQDWSAKKNLAHASNKSTTNEKNMPIDVKKQSAIFYPCKNVYAGGKNSKLSPLPNGKDGGIELVPILAKQKRYPLKIHLDSTDVTNDRKNYYTTLWNRQGSAYLRELTQQMSIKQQQIKEMKAKDNEIIQRHYSTWDGFWGRPGHGAPRSAIKKQRLDRLLYPQMVPIGVH